MNKEETILKELNKFRDKIDKIFIGQTPKLPDEMDEIYDCDIYIWRHPGMGNSKQIITGNKLSICTATASYLENLITQGLMSEKELKELFKMVLKGHKGKLK